MRPLLLIPAALGALLLSTPATAAVIHGPQASGEAVLATEHAFAKRAAEDGTAVAFGAYMDPADGRSFGSGPPIRGAAEIARRMGAHGVDRGLSWEPEEIFVSAGGDMAVSWGLYSFKPKDPAAKPETGRFVTVWRKDATGAWKGIVDIGNPD